MKHLHPSERGQAIVLIAFAIAGLVAMTGLAIDGGFAFSDRRHAQNAADAAALSGALGKINALDDLSRVLNSEPGHTHFAGYTATELQAMDSAALQNLLDTYAGSAARNIAELHGFDNDILTNTVTVHIPPEGDGPYAGNPLYVQVIIETNRDTFFAKVIGISQTHNRVEAIARTSEPINEPLFGFGPLISVAPNSGGDSGCNGEFIVGGSGNVIVDGGGIFVNSDSECGGFVQSGCNIAVYTNEVDENGDPISVPVTTVGGYNEDDCADDNVDTVNEPDAAPIIVPDDIYLLAENPPDDRPPQCRTAPEHIPQYNPSTDVTTFWPGRYDEFPPVPREDGSYFLNPGIYCVRDLSVPTNAANGGTLIGDGIFFYIRGTTNAPISISGGIVNLSAYYTDNYLDPLYKYSGYLMYVEPHFEGNPMNCTINGNSVSSYIGTIYAPYCSVTMNGSTGTEKGYRSQIVGWTLKLNGNGDLWFIYDPEDQGGQKVPAELDLAQ